MGPIISAISDFIIILLATVYLAVFCHMVFMEPLPTRHTWV